MFVIEFLQTPEVPFVEDLEASIRVRLGRRWIRILGSDQMLEKLRHRRQQLCHVNWSSRILLRNALWILYWLSRQSELKTHHQDWRSISRRREAHTQFQTGFRWRTCSREDIQLCRRTPQDAPSKAPLRPVGKFENNRYLELAQTKNTVLLARPKFTPIYMKSISIALKDLYN